MGDLISRQAAIDAVKCGALSAAMVYGRTDAGSTAQSETVKAIKALPSAQPETHEERTETHACDYISRQEAMAFPLSWEHRDKEHGSDEYIAGVECYRDYIEGLPSAQPTLYGYKIEHLELIARVLQKEDLPPERVVEALTDIGRIVAIVKDEFEETLRKAVEQCTI